MVDVKSGVTSVLCLFCLFFVFLFPVWWGTSRVYRASLPDLTNISFTNHVEIPVRILYRGTVDKKDLDSMTATLIQSLQSEQKFKYVLETMAITSSELTDIASTDTSQSIDQNLHNYLNSQADVKSSHLSFFIMTDTHTPDTPEPKWTMGQYFHGWIFLKPTAVFNNGVTRSLGKLLTFVTHPQGSSKYESVWVQMLSDYTLSLSLLNALPMEGEWFSWQIEQAISLYLEPFINKLSPIFTTSLDSQVLHYADLTETLHSPSSIQRHPSGEYHYMDSAVLRTFVGNTKWNRESPLVKSSIEVLVYVPSKDHRSLFIKDGKNLSTSFIVPRWGSVVILNDLPPPIQGEALVIPAGNLKEAMQSVLSQLRIMLRLTPNNQHNDIGEFLSNPVTGITEWELQCLMRYRLLKNFEKVEDTLQSLSQLLVTVTKLPVEDDVAQRVHDAVDNLRLAHNSINEATCLASMNYSRHAVKGAEDAFFHPSMLPALYFPEEHLYAVYAPFFFPTVVPIAGAIMTRLKMARKSKLQSKES